MDYKDTKWMMVKKSRQSYALMAPYFIFHVYNFAGGYGDNT